MVCLKPGIWKKLTLNTEWLWSLRKLSESGSIQGHYTEQTDLKLDSLSFLTLITKLHSHSAFRLATSRPHMFFFSGFWIPGFRQSLLTGPLRFILLAQWATKYLFLLAQHQNLLPLGNRTFAFFCPEAMKGKIKRRGTPILTKALAWSFPDRFLPRVWNWVERLWTLSANSRRSTVVMPFVVWNDKKNT